MASQFDRGSLKVTAAGDDTAPSWLREVETIGEARRLLFDLCTNYGIHQAMVLTGDQNPENVHWSIKLSTQNERQSADFLPYDELTDVLNHKLQSNNLIKADIPANDQGPERRLYFVVAENQMLHKTVFVFESQGDVSFATLAELRLASEILIRNFNNNNIFTDTTRCDDYQLSDLEIELLRLKSAGASDDRLAAVLNLSPHTIYYLLKRVMKKLGCSSSHSAVAKISKLERYSGA